MVGPFIISLSGDELISKFGWESIMILRVLTKGIIIWGGFLNVGTINPGNHFP